MGHSQSSTTTRARTPDGFFAFRGSPRQTLYFRPRRGEAGTRGASTLLAPKFVTAYGERDRAMVLPAEAGFIITHQETLGEQLNRHLSRLSPDGKLLWTVKDEPGGIKMGHLSGDVVLVVVKAHRKKRSYVVAISWQDGKVRWRYGI